MFNISEVEYMLKDNQQIIQVKTNGIEECQNKTFIIDKNTFVNDLDRIGTEILDIDRDSIVIQKNNSKINIYIEDFSYDTEFRI